MLEIAKGKGRDIHWIEDTFENSAGQIGEFDWIFCHNILEYVEDPLLFLACISGCQKMNGYLSLIAHNPTAKVMKKAVMNKDPDEARASMGNNKEYSGIIQTDITTYTVEELSEWLSQCGYEIVERFGIHNLYGYISDNDLKRNDEWHRKMCELEYEVGNQSPYRDIAIFTHMVAGKRVIRNS